MYKKLLYITYRLEQNRIFLSIKKGLLILVPVLVTGSIALMLRSLPLPAFHDFLAGAADGLFLRILDMIYDATFGLMSVYLLCGISYFYAAGFQEEDESFRLLSMAASLAAFLVSLGAPSGSFSFVFFGAVGVFTAVYCAIGATALFYLLYYRLPHRFRSYTPGADHQFHAAVLMIVPLALTVLVFTLLNLLIQGVFGVQNLNDLIASAALVLFRNLPGELESGMLFVALLDLLWFFGMHGGNVMEPVANAYFVPANADMNLLIGKSLLDNFALMGGCGATLCLLLAMLLFSKTRSSRQLACSAAPFALFNMNELLVFGLPVIFNPILFIPFLATPLLSLLIAYGATAIGFLPVMTQTITWTTPVLLSGYIATGSYRGVVVQLVILAVGTAVYAPFIKMGERAEQARERMLLEDFFQSFSQRPAHIAYLDRRDHIGVLARAVVSQLRLDIETWKIPVWYQPQMDAAGRMIGAEALLRWRYHDIPVPPPLVVMLAQEDGVFDQMTDVILQTAADDMVDLFEDKSAQFTLSVNISAEQLDSPAFIKRVIALIERQHIQGFCLEVTEEDALGRYSHIEMHLKQLREHAISVAIDDFSMGHTSIKYLQNNAFQFVKLDGELVRQLPHNSRSRDIIHSMITLGQDLGFEVVAEYVEDAALRDQLLALGCQYFQGYLFSPAIPAEELAAMQKSNRSAYGKS